MEPEQSARLEHILGHMTVGAAILDGANLSFRYANQYFTTLLEEPWRSQGVVGASFNEVVPEEVRLIALPLLQQVNSTGESATYTRVPYEGFLEARGRTYWNITIEPSALSDVAAAQHDDLFITIEDVTNLERSRLHLNAIHYISSAIAGPFALPRVLDRILVAVQEMVGSTRCAVMLIDQSVSGFDLRMPGFEEQLREISIPREGSTSVTIAAQKGLHLISQDWRPQLDEQLLLGHVVRERRTLVITNTSTTPEIELPLLDDKGTPRRPGSVLCVPIFEPTSTYNQDSAYSFTGKTYTLAHTGAVLGTIEVYHRRPRGFPAEEVELLEQFAQQAGLAIQNTRLFRGLNRLARVASRHARQQKNVMQAIPDGVIIFDPRWRIADANQAIRQLMGWSDEVIGMNIIEAQAHGKAIIQDDITQTPDFIAELERHAVERRVDEFKMIGANGQGYAIRRSHAPIHDELGDIFAFVVIYHDVTEQVAARESIEAEVVARTAELAQRNRALQLAKAAQEFESARLQLLLERLPSGVMLVSAADNRITLINYQAVQLLQRIGVTGEIPKNPGQTTSSMIGLNLEELLQSIVFYTNAGSILSYDERPLGLALHNGESSEAEVHITQPDGQNLFMLVNAAPLRTPDGTITGAVTVWHDITRLKALERVREDFFTTMAHELKTPLANIRAHLSALQASDLLWSTRDQHEFLETADEQVERLVGMINYFLDASRVEAGALRLAIEPLLLPELLEDLEERLVALISSSHRHLNINVPADLPAVLGDYELIISVLTNLLSNAFRYAPEGDIVTIEAELLSDPDDQFYTGVEIRVIDRGPGMTQEQLSALFTRFSTFAAMRRPTAERPGQTVQERRKGTARWSPATGLGLYISRGIIEAHGSTLMVKSSPGNGATFSFILAVPNTHQTHPTQEIDNDDC